MFVDARDLNAGATIEADVCIVGAGAAGITLARDLMDTGLAVALVEGGGLDESAESQALYAGRNVGLPYDGLEHCRQRFFGGTTNGWAGWCRPLDDADFDAWPIAATDMRPWYLKAHRTCEIGAFEYDADAIAQRLNMPQLPVDPTLAQTVLYQISPPTRFGQVYRTEVERAQDVSVFLNCNLTAIEVSEPGDRVVALRCATLTGGSLTVTAERYVLATGGIENARMLLASGANGIANTSGLVGVGFAEHPHLFVGAMMLLDGTPDLRLYEHHLWETPTFDEEAPEGRTARVLASLALSEMARQRENLPNLACSFGPLDIDNDGGTGPLGASDMVSLLGTVPRDARLISLNIRAEQALERESVVRLSDEKDALGVPRVALDWRVGETDLAGVGRSMQLLGAALGSAGTGRLWMPSDDERYLPPPIGGGCHHMGTTRMSSSAGAGVVNADGRLHTIDNMYIAGSSVFPSVGYANPTLTIVALAHRLAAHLADTT